MMRSNDDNYTMQVDIEHDEYGKLIGVDFSIPVAADTIVMSEKFKVDLLRLPDVMMSSGTIHAGQYTLKYDRTNTRKGWIYYKVVSRGE